MRRVPTVLLLTATALLTVLAAPAAAVGIDLSGALGGGLVF
ncbi:hypothetical protein [Streptomyces sp. NPDC047928]